MFDFGNMARAFVEAIKMVARLLWQGMKWIYGNLVKFGRWIAKNPDWGITSICLILAWLAP